MKLLPVEDLADAAVADPQLAADHAGPDPGCRHLDNLQPTEKGLQGSLDPLYIVSYYIN